MMRSVVIVYASTSGHTEYVVDTLMGALAGDKSIRVSKQRAELTKPADLESADIVLLASSTWNTGNVEGQLNPHMHELITGRAASCNLKSKPAAAIGLGDERYYYTARAADLLTEYLKSRSALTILPTLKIINDPYGQEEKVKLWAKEFAVAAHKLPVATH